MTAPSTLIAALPPFGHKPWCHTDHCAVVSGQSAIHRHHIGTVARTEVWVEQIDDYDADGNPRTSPALVNIYGHGEQGMNPVQVGQFADLCLTGAKFAEGWL
jgi:hypothetical protein